MPASQAGRRRFESGRPLSLFRLNKALGNLTVRGKTKPTVWKVTAQFQPATVTGAAQTAFTFNDFEIQQPRVPVVLSVADTIKLELDFSMVREAAKR